MGKKTKVGKQRKDKFYHLAKETGYRSRSAFKLIQLNRKFGFLQTSRCLIDLCAAPGGWLQVASKFMPVSSIIVGVDLVPIKAIHNVITIQEDITTDRCRQLISKEIHTWKADCVLNDGAPNVGSAWIQDAFTQAQLTLSALKLACDFLQEGGWFITKVFRSKDYQPLLWVFQQLFKRVHSTKPQASRSESAEIFVVCQGYIAPAKIDPKLLDPKHIFKEVEPEGKKKVSILQVEKQKKRAEGYDEGDYTLFRSVTVSDFLQAEQPLDILSLVNEIVFDDLKYSKHVLTTEDVKEAFKDVKVLGKSDIKNLLSWHKALRKEFYDEQTEDTRGQGDEQSGLEENEEEIIEKTIQGLKDEEIANVKREKRKVQKQRQKLQEKMKLKMIIPGDTKGMETDMEMFSLANIKSKQHLDYVDDADMNEADNEDHSESEQELESESDHDSEDDEEKNEDSKNEEGELEFEEENGEADDSNAKQQRDKNPLLVELEPEVPLTIKANKWFEKDAFKGLEDDADEDLEISQMAELYKKQGGTILEKNSESDLGEQQQGTKRGIDEKPKQAKKKRLSDKGDSDSEESDSSTDSEEDNAPAKTTLDNEGKKVSSKGNDFEVVPVEDNSEYLKKLTPEALALGHKMAFSRKNKRDIIDSGYHRWAFNDDNLPSWFVEDETKHYQRQIPVTKEIVEEYRAKMKEINSRSVKKIAEAKARKKRKEMKRLEKARQKAEAICDTVDVSEKEKMNQIRSLYKKAVGSKRKEVKYVVAKKSQAAKRMKRPAGVKGPYKIVDQRMKKDLRSQRANEKRNKKSGKRRR